MSTEKVKLCVIGFILLSATFFSGSLYGQYFIKAGYTKASVNFQETYAQTFYPINSSVFGFGYNTAIDSGYFSFQVEALIIQKGSEDVYDTHGSARERIETTTKISYLEVPLLLKYTIGKKSFQFYLNGGFSLAFGLGGNYKSVRRYQDQYPNGPWDIEKYDGKVKFGGSDQNVLGEDLNVDNRIDVGYQLGGGFLIIKKIIIDFRLGKGFTNLYSKDEDNPNSNPRSKNKTLQFSLGYVLSEKKVK